MATLPAHRRIRRGLIERKMSKAAFARLLGRDRTYVSHLTAGRSRPGLDMAARIEALTADWGDCAVRASEWAGPLSAAAADPATSSTP